MKNHISAFILFSLIPLTGFAGGTVTWSYQSKQLTQLAKAFDKAFQNTEQCGWAPKQARVDADFAVSDLKKENPIHIAHQVRIDIKKRTLDFEYSTYKLSDNGWSEYSRAMSLRFSEASSYPFGGWAAGGMDYDFSDYKLLNCIADPEAAAKCRNLGTTLISIAEGTQERYQDIGRAGEDRWNALECSKGLARAFSNTLQKWIEEDSKAKSTP